MLDADYLRHIKFLGKLTFGYDTASSGVAALTTLQATTMDQVADALVTSLPETRILAGYMSVWTNNLTSTSASQQMMLDIATALFTSADFRAGLTTVPATTAVSDVIAAWKTDFGLNSKTFTTASSTGLLHFISLLGSITSWPASGSPTYADSTYCVSTVV